ncbi:hypothetical protein M378DRAFT_16748 [Amanita muscaria Koide BX008]|uniref:Uncharacterized protein n=1 Tax=Amanita muscaria (strain Koide BX008) TaxID=946122 RepID=A0A0C2S2D3_AMAMK|nr:hypothetical protein M378DRAFT_16748 [Amanita muscaria Koide BX008]
MRLQCSSFSVVLTESGKVFTFGSAEKGQLGSAVCILGTRSSTREGEKLAAQSAPPFSKASMLALQHEED